MTFALGIYDLFTYSIPGFLYFSVFGYVAVRADWINVSLKDVKDVPSLLLVIGVAIICYLVGHVTIPAGKLVDRFLYRRWHQEDAVRGFIAAVPGSEGRPYLRHGLQLLQTKVELTNREVAAEISRLRAVGLMLRNCSVPIILGVVCALTELAIGREKGLGAALAVLLAGFAAGAVWQGQLMRHWANLKTFELAYWDDQVDIPPGPQPQAAHD